MGNMDYASSEIWFRQDDYKLQKFNMSYNFHDPYLKVSSLGGAHRSIVVYMYS